MRNKTYLKLILALCSLNISFAFTPITKLQLPENFNSADYFESDYYWSNLQNMTSCSGVRRSISIPEAIQGVYRGYVGNVRKVNPTSGGYSPVLLRVVEAPLLRLSEYGVSGASFLYSGIGLERHNVYPKRLEPLTNQLAPENFCIDQEFSGSLKRGYSFKLTFKSYHPNTKHIWNNRVTYTLRFKSSDGTEEGLRLASFYSDDMLLSKRITNIEDFHLSVGGWDDRLVVVSPQQTEFKSYVKADKPFIYLDRNQLSTGVRYYSVK